MPASRRRSRDARRPRPADDGPATGYSTREVADALGLPTSRILSWTRRGLIEPVRDARGSFVYSFRDLALLRTARDLMDRDIPLRRVREALGALRAQLPADRPLSALTLRAEGRRVLVTDGEATWEPDSGQLQLLPDAPPAEPDPGPRRPSLRLVRGGADGADASVPGAIDPRTADDWYDLAVDAEATDLGAALAAYRRAIELDPGLGDAHLNLGRLLHEEGDLAGARAAWLDAIRVDDRNARAHYNLGVVLEDEGAVDDALEAYRAAVDRDPALAVAHFNLARLLEAGGQPAAAIRHLAEYRRLVGERSDADE